MSKYVANKMDICKSRRRMPEDGVTPNKLGSGGSWERVGYPAFGAPVLFCGHVHLRVCSCVVGG